MSRVVDEFRISQYAVLKLDKMPDEEHQKYRIDGIDFQPVPIYDMPDCIAIQSERGDFIGKTVEFV
ncbi:MAG: hypothetical protein ACLRVB_05605 [Blautia sp.]|nr:hypothetical protein [Clostridiales bacterium]DAG85352.1 MAG TPA: hypothetical protein [Caudoviricetes sp.]